LSSTITVHVRVNDSAAGKPTPVRLRIAGPGGEFFSPLGRFADFPLGRNEVVGGHAYLGGKKYVYIDGSCEIRLPAGVPLEVEINKGPEYETIRQTVTLGPGQMALRFVISRWTKATGWISADSRCHFLTPHTALLEAACEDVDIVHLLAVEEDHRSEDGHCYKTIPSMTAFSGQQVLLAENGRAIVCNSFNTHPALGRLGLLNCHRPVYPLRFGGDAGDDWSLNDWCNQCHRKNGLTVWSDAYRPEAGIAGGEALVAAILSKIDALEFDGRERNQPLLPAWYRLLNTGLRLPLVGGSGKDSNRIALGSMRTYARTSAELSSPSAWIEAVRLGNAFVTNGPLLELTVNGLPCGGAMEIEPGQKLAIQAAAKSIVPYDKLEIIVNGRVVAENGRQEPIEIEHELSDGGWIAARCFGSARSELDQHSAIFAHTSPIYVTVSGKPPRSELPALKSIGREVEQVRHWIETTGRFEQEKSKTRLIDLCDEALRALALREAPARLSKEPD
jgi:hypothetical protein